MSDGQKYIIVNNEAGSAVVDGFSDLVSYIEQLSKEKTETPVSLSPLADELTKSVESNGELASDTQKLFMEIAENSKILLSSPPAEFEPAFNLLWYVLSSAPNFEELIPVTLDKLTATFPSFPAQRVALLAVLGNLFNIVKPDSKQKPLIFQKLVDLAISVNAAEQFVPQFPQLAEWLHEWKYANTADVVEKLANAVDCCDAEVISFLWNVVSLEPELASVAELLVLKALACQSSQGDAPVVSLDALLTLPGVQNLKQTNAELLTGLQAIANGDYSAFSSTKYSTDENLKRQAQSAAIAKLASSTTEGELKFADIAKELQIPDDEVELVLMQAVKAKFVEGRINQLSSTFAVERSVVVGQLTEQHWDTIESRLQSWKKSLNAILEASNKAHKNRDLVKSLNKLEVN